MKNIAIVSATRAEFGLLSNLIQQVDDDSQFNLQLFITGSHLLQSQGNTLSQIKDKFNIIATIPILEEDTNSYLDTAIATSKALAGFAEAFAIYKPDIVIVLGDRYELLGICSAALLSHIPIAHIHGGEITTGAMDDAIRHSITKLANLHFVAAKEYKQRVLQMGEQKSSVFNVGAVGLDVINAIEFITKPQLEQDFGFKLQGKIVLITYHPVSWGSTMGKLVLKKLFAAIIGIKNATVIWTAANNDASGQQLNKTIKQWTKKQPNVYFIESLGSQKYLSVMKIADLVLGNSSSGIIEAPVFGVPTINIGQRQDGRLKASSIIDCGETQAEIAQAIKKALSEDFKQKAKQTTSLYGAGQTAKKIIAQIKVFLSLPTNKLTPKKFNDINEKKPKNTSTDSCQGGVKRPNR